MTKEERKRALLLERVLREYGQTGIMNRLLIFGVIAILLIDMILLFSAASDDELYMVLPFHCFLTPFFLGIMSTIITSAVGDRTILNNNSSQLSLGGSIYAGKLLCNLPFKAKDMLVLRLINFEKQLFFTVITTAGIEIILIIAENMGYSVYCGFGGIAVIALLVSEIIIMCSLFANNAVIFNVLGAAGILLPMAVILCFAQFADNHETSAVFAESFDFMSIFTGVSGIVILIVLSFAIIFAERMYLKSIKNVSWHLK